MALPARRLFQLFLVRKFSYAGMAIHAGNGTMHIGFVVLVATEAFLGTNRAENRYRKQDNDENQTDRNLLQQIGLSQQLQSDTLLEQEGQAPGHDTVKVGVGYLLKAFRMAA
ncbi:MAG TPA: hypothetical protein VKF36_06740 [Syntrophorhabdales bacterium]|nr:hypothetical protein [Syntrophorhabdales bacterium]